MAQVIPVGTSAVKISGTASKPYLISNDPSSQTTIYIGQYSNVSAVNYGVKLQPGGSLTWTEITSEVWAISATTSTANITVIYEANAMFSSQVSNLSAASPTLLATKTINVQLNGVTGSAQTAYIDSLLIAQYTTLRVQVSTTINNSGGVTTASTSLDANAYVQFVGIQADTSVSNANYYGQQQAIWPLGSGSSTSGGNPAGLVTNIRTYEFPVNNIYLTGDSTALTGSNIKVSSGTLTSVSLTVTVRIYGTNNTPRGEIYYNGATGNFPSALGTFTYPQWGINGSISATGTYTLPSYNGEATVNLYPQTAATTAANYVITFFTPDFLSAWAGNIGSGALTAPGTQYLQLSQNFIFPNVPVRIVFTSTGSAPSLSITQTRQ